jgi:hypothetical protein
VENVSSVIDLWNSYIVAFDAARIFLQERGGGERRLLALMNFE